MFSTYLYKGNNSTQTITNNIDLSTNGGLVWTKMRDGGFDHQLVDTARGVTKIIASNLTDIQSTDATSLTAFNTTGYTIGIYDRFNDSAYNYVSWTFRKQPKFFDIVTYTGTGSNRTISHSLGSVPGCILIKRLSGSAVNWAVYHRSLANTQYLVLNSTAAVATGANWWNSTTPTSSVFSLGINATVNDNGSTYVAYIFAHDAGGFGLTGTDNVISCGTYTGNGSATGPVVTLGYEPQWLMIKKSSSTGNWQMLDNMRGIPVGSDDASLQANSTAAESFVGYLSPTSTGFQITSTNTEVNTNAATYIYIAIRRGPMEVPTSGTSVFGLSARTGTGANATVTGGQTDDAVLVKNRGSAVASLFSSRLTGTGYLVTSSTAAEVAAGVTILQANPWDVMDGVKVGTTSTITNASSNTFINYLFRRAPSFFDEVCYTGTGATDRDVAHNLGVIPEAIIIKSRSSATYSWGVRFYGSGNTDRTGLALNNTLDAQNAGFGTTGLSGTTFNPYYVAGNNGSNASNFGDNAYNLSDTTYVAYLFATLAGVSKVGSYTGTATTKQIDCGFTAGARFVLIKRTDSTGDWYVWDTARGIVSGNDSYLLLNSTAAEVTNTDYIDTYSAGFEISSTAPAAINASGGSFIFFAVA
jgi:hypothetical protein